MLLYITVLYFPNDSLLSSSNNAEVTYLQRDSFCQACRHGKKLIGDIEFFDGQVCETGQLADEAGQVGGCWLW